MLRRFKAIGFPIITVLAALAILPAGCSRSNPSQPSNDVSKGFEDSIAGLTVGFAQIGAESEWRTAETGSIKEAAGERGVNLKFSDAQQKQENQVKAVRAFICLLYTSRCV